MLLTDVEQPSLPHPLHLPTQIATQSRLPCAAKHLFWSSIYGSIFGDDGRYDAFEMTMEILRVKKENPNLEPRLYAQKDEAFRSFLHCEAAEGA